MKDWNEAHINGHDARGTADEIWARTAATSLNGHGSSDTLPDISILHRNQIAAPPFPLEVFGPAADWVRDTAETKSAPVEYVAVSMLAVAASMIGAKRHASPWLGWYEPAIFWGGLIGPPSFGKSPSNEPHRNAVRRVEDVLNADWEARTAEYEKQLQLAEARKTQWEQEAAAAISKGIDPPEMPAEAREPAKPTRRRIVIGDATTEKVAHLLSENPAGLLCIRDELAGWHGAFDKYGGSGSDKAFWLEVYGGRAARYDRMKYDDPVDIQFCAVSILGGIQPDRLNSMMMTDDDDGMLARFIFAWPDMVRSRRPTRFADEQPLVDALLRLAALDFDQDEDGSNRPRVVRLESIAADEFQAWWERTQWDAKMAATGRVQGAVGKLDGFALRLAMLLEYLTWAWRRGNTVEPEVISLASVRSSIALIEQWVRPTLARVFAEASLPQVHRDAMTVARWLLKTRPRPTIINARELRRQAGFPGPKDVKLLDAALEFLAEARWLKQETKPQEGPGRRRKDFDVNPRIYNAAD